MTDKYDEIALQDNYKKWIGWTEEDINDYREAYARYQKMQTNIPNNYSSSSEEVIEIPSEMFEFISVLYHSANTGKYDKNNWLKPDGTNADHTSMCNSMFRHLAAAQQGEERDKDSGLHPLLHLAARALMLYTRKKRGLK